jgi:prophage regulatory protein
MEYKMDRILRLHEIIQRTGMCRAWIYASRRKKTFPPGFKIGARARGWTESSIDEWLAGRIAQSPTKAGTAETDQ